MIRRKLIEARSNWLLVAEAQHQAAASRRLLRARQR
jgi:hypothetical protein